MTKKLIDIVLQAYPEWPEGVEFITQDTDMELRCYGPYDTWDGTAYLDRFVEELGSDVTKPCHAINELGSENGSARVYQEEYDRERGAGITPELQASIARQIARMIDRRMALRACIGPIPEVSGAGRALKTAIAELTGRIARKKRLHASNQAKLDALQPKARFVVVNQLGRRTCAECGVILHIRSLERVIEDAVPVRVVHEYGNGTLDIELREDEVMRIAAEDCAEAQAPGK